MDEEQDFIDITNSAKMEFSGFSLDGVARTRYLLIFYFYRKTIFKSLISVFLAQLYIFSIFLMKIISKTI